MKLENDPGNVNPSPPRKSYNPFDSDDDALDSPGLKSENMYVKENLNGFDLKAFERSSDTVIFHMDNGEFLWEEDVLGQPATDRHAFTATQPYTDKNGTDCELPEFVICYKESNIKDIGIDVGVPSNEKLWVQSGEDEDKNSSTFLDHSNKTHVDIEVEVNNTQLEVVESPKSTLDNQWKEAAKSDHPVKLDELNEEALTGHYLVHEFGDDDLLKTTELNLDLEDRVLPVVETEKGGLVADVADHHPTTEKETATRPSGHDKPDLTSKKGEIHDGDALEKKGHGNSKVEADTLSPSELLTEYGVEAMPIEIPNKEESLPNSFADAEIQESGDTHDPNKLAYNRKVENRSITFNFGSSTNSKPENQEHEPENTESPKPPAAQTMTRQEEKQEEKEEQGIVSSSSILFARTENRVHGETSFSAGMPVPLPSLIGFSEPLTYSGSISLRSESSAGTTSTRSFAFPVLQTDWNSSPTRMGKTGQRHMKKHRGWVQAFSCCKF